MWNFKIGRIAGIPIRINVTLLVFLPLLAWLLSRPEQISIYAGLIESVFDRPVDVPALTEANTALTIGALSAVGLFAAVLLHELGHSFVALRNDISITSITLWIFGGMAHMEDLPEDWDVEFRIALAGPAVSLALAVVLATIVPFVPDGLPVLAFVIAWLAVINVILAIFNMLPAFPMDGGRVLRALLARNRPYAEATQIAARIGRMMAILLAIVGFFGGGPILILIALFVYVAAGSESRMTVMRDLLRDVTVRELMDDETETIEGDATVTELIERMLTERRSGYPVVDAGGAPVGFVSLDSIGGVDPDRRDDTRIEEIMADGALTIEADAEAFDALMEMGQGRTDRLTVVEGGRVVGVVSRSDVARAMELYQGIGSRRSQKLPPDGYA